MIGISSYKIDTTLIISPLLNYIVGDSILFTISSDFIFSNISNISGFEIDFDDGMGYRTCSLTNSSFQINYINDGLKILKFRISLQNNNIIEKNAKILYKSQELTALESLTEYPTHDTICVAKIPFQGYLSFDMNNYLGIVHTRTYYANPDRKLRRPIIICDGFDPGNRRRFEMTQADSSDIQVWRPGGIWGL